MTKLDADRVAAREAAIHERFQADCTEITDNIGRVAQQVEEGIPLEVVMQMAYSAGLQTGLAVAVASPRAGATMFEWLGRIVLGGAPEALAARAVMGDRWVKVLK